MPKNTESVTFAHVEASSVKGETIGTDVGSGLHWSSSAALLLHLEALGRRFHCSFFQSNASMGTSNFNCQWLQQGLIRADCFFTDGET